MEFVTVYNEKSKFFRDEFRLNRIALETKQTYANDKLRARGHLFLNEVLDILDVPRTREGQFAGWVWRKYHFETLVSFGLGGLAKASKTEIPLVFNCKDNILDDAFGNHDAKSSTSTT